MAILTSERKAIPWLKSVVYDELGWAWILVGIAWLLLLTLGHGHGDMPHAHFPVHDVLSDHAHSHLSTNHSSPSQGAAQGFSLTQESQWLQLLAAQFQTLLYHLCAWEVMLVAMMLPSVLPVAKLFIRISDRYTDRRWAQTAFLTGYLLIWTGFAILMAIGSAIAPEFLKLLSRQWPQELAHHWLQALILAGVGGFQFTPMKRACLKGCRSASTFLAQYYQQGIPGGFNFGLQHGLYCLGCCWALMIEMAILGMENLQWMLLFTAVMALERLWQYGEQLATAIGVLAIGAGGLLWVNGQFGLGGLGLFTF